MPFWDAEFIGQAPNSKKGKRVFFANLRDWQKKLNEEPAAVTGLTASTLRQYHAIARHFHKQDRVKGLSFTHHLALAHLPRINERDPDGTGGPMIRRAKMAFDARLASTILQQALAENWSVIKLRKHVRALKKPVAPVVPPGPGMSLDEEFGITPVDRAKMTLEELFKWRTPEEKLALMNILEAYLKEVQESVAMDAIPY